MYRIIMIQYSLMMFQESLKSKESVKNYTYCVKKFIQYYDLKDFDSIVKIEKKELQKLVETWTIHLKGKMNPNTIPSYINPIKTFLEANDIDLNWRKIKRLFPAKIKRSGSSAYSTEDVKKMLDVTPQMRNKAIIHFLASPGVRIGAVPELKLRHLRDMPEGCKMITLYEDSIEEYFTFLTPEAANALDDYLGQRRKEGELINEDSPLFRKAHPLSFMEPKPILRGALQAVLDRARKKAGVQGQKKNGRYAKQLCHGFRKRFNTTLKLNKGVNDNVIEKMMGHKNGLDGIYFVVNPEDAFEEFKNGIMDLTIDPTERQKHKIESLEKEKSELEKRNEENKLVKNEVFRQGQIIENLSKQMNELKKQKRKK